MVLICISLISVGHHFICLLAIWKSLEKYLFRPFPFLNGVICFYFCYWIVWFPCIFWILLVIRYVVCKCFLPFCWSAFHFVLIWGNKEPCGQDACDGISGQWLFCFVFCCIKTTTNIYFLAQGPRVDWLGSAGLGSRLQVGSKSLWTGSCLGAAFLMADHAGVKGIPTCASLEEFMSCLLICF